MSKDMIVCENCNCVCEESYITTNEGETLCEECAYKYDYVECRECGEFYPEVDCKYDEQYGNHVCENCYYDNGFITCEDCGEITDNYYIVNRDEMYERAVCFDCVDNYCRCDHCNEYFSDRYFWRTNNLNICDNCSYYYEVCCECEEIIYEDNVYWDDGCPYCNECYNSKCNIYNYDYKPEPIFLGSNLYNTLYMGVELEVDDGKQNINTARELQDVCSYIYCKKDGSLNNGFEIVTHPATLDYHLNKMGWKSIVDICKNNNYKSHDTETCGLHVHVNRKFFGEHTDEQDLNIAKLILLINRFWDTHIVQFSRRHYKQLERWAKKNELNYESDDTEGDVREKFKYVKDNGDRYQAINLENYNTIEFRMFRGTLELSTILATLQFVDTISRFAKDVNLKKISSTTWEDIFENTEYKELRKYCESRGLLKRKTNKGGNKLCV